MHGGYRTGSQPAFHLRPGMRQGQRIAPEPGEQQHETTEMIMRALILAAAIATATLLIATSLPAEAAYVSPDWSWQMQAFCLRGC